MPLVTMNELLLDARRGRCAVGAFETWNLESCQTVVRAAENLDAPVILAIGPLEIDYAGIEPLARIAVEHARAARVPVAIHLDHGPSCEMAVDAIRNGFTSVMIDASREPFDENVRVTSEVARVAHAAGVTVEGELGVLGVLEGGGPSGAAVMTEPEDARKYVAATGVDALAVAIGNAHGYYKGEPKLDIERLKAIEDAVDIPLVLHGGTGIPRDTLHKAINAGITKINIATQFFDAFAKGYHDAYRVLQGPINVGNVFAPAMRRGQALVEEKITMFLNK